MADQLTSASPPAAGTISQFPKRTLATLIIYQAILFLVLGYLMITLWPSTRPPNITPTAPSNGKASGGSKGTGATAPAKSGQGGENHGQANNLPLSNAKNATPPPSAPQAGTGEAQPSTWTYFYLFGNVKVLVTEDMQLLLLVMVVGAFGSLIQEAMALTTRVANHTMEPSWITWYYMRPLIGTAIATILYLAFRGGLFNPNPTAGASQVNIHATAALAGLAGWFSGQAAKKMEQVFDTFFNVQTKAATPIIIQLQPPSVNVGTATPVALTITGTNFVPGSMVRFDGVAQPTTYVSSGQLTTTLPPDKVAQDGVIHVTVFNPASGESSPAALTVKAA